jgi:hypothetical protein
VTLAAVIVLTLVGDDQGLRLPPRIMVRIRPPVKASGEAGGMALL